MSIPVSHPPSDPSPAQGERARLGIILSLGLPIIGGMISQNVLNLVDTAMVGSLGATALAAVGTASFANFAAIAFLLGLSSSVQALAARRLGEGNIAETARPLNGALLISLAVGIPASALLITLTPKLFPLLNSNATVASLGVPYLCARLSAMTAVGMNFSFRGFWNATNRPGLYLRTLLLMHSCNIFLNWLLIFGHLGAPELGAPGAGVASAIATYVGTLYYWVLGLSHARDNGFLHARPTRHTISLLLELAIPNGLRTFLFATGFTAMFWILGKIGTTEAGTAHVLMQVMLISILPGIALGMAATSLVGQALGRREPGDAKRWGWDVARLGVYVGAAIAVPMLLFPDQIVSVFIHDPSAVELARLPLRIFALGMFADGAGSVLQNALLGAGASRQTMWVSVISQWFLFLPAAYLVGITLGFGLLGVWIAFTAYRVLQAGLYSLLWQRGSWAKIEI